MPDDLVERFRGMPSEALAAAIMAWIDQAQNHITALTARLAALEQATPEEVVEMAAHALWDIYADSDIAHEGARAMSWAELVALALKDPGGAADKIVATAYNEARAVISVISAPLRAQGAAAERERAAKLLENARFGCAIGRAPVLSDGAVLNAVLIEAERIAAAIRAGGSGG